MAATKAPTSSLKTLLESYTAEFSALGGEEQQLDLDRLRQDLDVVRKNNSQIFWICVGMVLLLFLVIIVMTMMRLDSPILAGVLQGAFGVTAAGLICWMFHLWRTKLFTETLLAMAQNGSEPALRQLLLITKNMLLKNISATGPLPD